VAEGDLVTYLNVWKAWEAAGRSGRWAHRHLINHRTMLRAADIRRQLLQHLWCACVGAQNAADVSLGIRPCFHTHETHLTHCM